MLRTLSLLKRNAFTAVGSNYDINSYDRPRASVKLFELGVRTPGGSIFGRKVRQGYRFSAFFVPGTPSLLIFGVIFILILLSD